MDFHSPPYTRVWAQNRQGDETTPTSSFRSASLALHGVGSVLSQGAALCPVKGKLQAV